MPSPGSERAADSRGLLIEVVNENICEWKCTINTTTTSNHKLRLRPLDPSEQPRLSRFAHGRVDEKIREWKCDQNPNTSTKPTRAIARSQASQTTHNRRVCTGSEPSEAVATI